VYILLVGESKMEIPDESAPISPAEPSGLKGEYEAT